MGLLFQMPMHNNFWQANVIQLELFTQALYWEYYSKIKNLVVIYFLKDPNFEFKTWKRKKSESVGFLKF